MKNNLTTKVVNLYQEMTIGFILKKDDKEFPMRVHLNEEFYKGNEFNFGSLRRMEFRIGENTTEYGRIYRSSGKVSKKFVDNLYQTYIDLYGKPDSLKQILRVGIRDIEEDTYLSEKKKNDKEKTNSTQLFFTPTLNKDYLNGKKAVWIKDNFILTFNIPTIKKPQTPNEKVYYQKDYDRSILISYEMKSYKEELIRLKDSISKGLNPNDIIQFNIVSSKFTNSNQLLIKLSSVSLKDTRKADFLTDKIKGFKYDILIKDSYNELIFRKDNLEYQFEHTLGDNGNGEISVDETYPYYKDLLIDINTEIPQNKKTNFKVITEIKELRLEDERVIK